MSKAKSPRQRLAEHINARMAEIPINITELVIRSDVNAISIRRLRTADEHNTQQNTLRKVSIGLGWTATSAEDVLAGKEATLALSETMSQRIALLGAIDATGLTNEQRTQIQAFVNLIREANG
jgi:hypothetical protein